jgi:hypothetical protein
VAEIEFAVKVRIEKVTLAGSYKNKASHSSQLRVWVRFFFVEFGLI